jgi:hypothetical protein
MKPDDHSPPHDEPLEESTRIDPLPVGSGDDPSPQTSDETLAELPAGDLKEQAGETTAEFGPGWKSNLVAYLDGELSEPDMQELDEVLLQDPSARANVEQLRQTWDLLDVLPRPSVTEEFSAQTLATIQAIQDDDPLAPPAWTGRILVVGLWIVLLSVSSAAGVFVADRWQPDPTDHLIQHLSVVERLEVYRDIGDIDFLVALAATDRFPRNDNPELSPLVPIPETDEGRWTYVAELPSDRRRQLKKNLLDFDNLVDPGRLKLEQLDRRVTEKENLAKIASDFHDWTKTLQPWQRDELRKQRAGASSKVELVVKYLDEQKKRADDRAAGWPVAFGNRKSPVLDRVDFSKVIKVISDRLPPMMKQQLMNNVEVQGTAYALRVVELSTSSGRPRSGDRPPTPAGRIREQWPNMELGRAIAEVISDGSVREWLDEVPRGEPARIRLATLMIRSLWAEGRRELKRNEPTSRDLQELFVGLSREDQDDLMTLPTSEYRERLKRFHHRQTNPEGIAHQRQRLLRLIGRLLPRRGRRNGNGTNKRGLPSRGQRPGPSPSGPPATPPPGGTR